MLERAGWPYARTLADLGELTAQRPAPRRRPA
jgi:hypothetical protein